MSEKIIKKKVIKQRRKKKTKPSQKQSQRQTQIINVYTQRSGLPLSANRQKAKNSISPMENSRVYRPLAINQHVNSFEVEQRLYRKIADETQLTEATRRRERELQQAQMNAERVNEMRNLQKTLLERDQEFQKRIDQNQEDIFNFINAKERKIGDIMTKHLEPAAHLKRNVWIWRRWRFRREFGT